LAGVAILVDNVRYYLLSHVKGIAQAVLDSEIPREYLADFLEAKAEIQSEHIEEDLEAERVNSLYLMNHYLRVRNSDSSSQSPWWKPVSSDGSPLIDSLVRNYWDQGPFAQIKSWVGELTHQGTQQDVIELGCGVGGLALELKDSIRSYLGVDSSFASIALARHIALGVPYRGKIQIPGDLLQGPVSRKIDLPIARSYQGNIDFVVGDIESPPLQSEQWDLAIALNAIDMLDTPSQLPELKLKLLKKNGRAIQSCPYVWHETVARKLRGKLPREIQDSAQAVEYLYQQAGFKIERSMPHLPWLFFKHLRQIEIYSVHLFQAKK
jgi:SAM-dependent methyltransferase